MRKPIPTYEQSSGLRILVVALGGASNISGVSRHAANLVECLLTHDEVEEVHLVLGAWQLESFRSVLPQDDPRLHLHVAAASNRMIARNWWHWSGLPKLARLLRVGLVHLAYPMLVRRSAIGCPIVVTLHDLYPYDVPDNFGFPKVLFHRAILQQCLAAVDAVACVSESTRQRLLLYAPNRVMDKSIRIYNCVEPKRHVEVPTPVTRLQGGKFLLCVAQHRRNKNVVLAMQIFAELLRCGDLEPDTRLVVVGISGPETQRIQHYVRGSGLCDRIVLLEGIADAELSWCYGHCELLLAPSSVEGFGLPVVEAMFHQCRVVCSDIPAFREVGGSYCDYANLQTDPLGSFVHAAQTALKSHKFRAASTECFSRVRIAEAYLRLYTRLCGGGISLAKTEGVRVGTLIEGREQ